MPPSLQIIKKSESASNRSLSEIIENKEKELIIDALKKFNGQQRRAAKELGLTERILGYKIKKYGIFPKLLS
ncbi:MAG: Nitrogen fixation protein VnfA [Planctomycetes bacterium ADurb.Bin401]|nr:MAG: Nitrogen fixation protein VnfA [Planctomycetes bacterium ADurb.Bin401]